MATKSAVLLRRLRTRAGHKDETLARALGVSRPLVTKWQNEKIKRGGALDVGDKALRKCLIAELKLTPEETRELYDASARQNHPEVASYFEGQIAERDRHIAQLVAEVAALRQKRESSRMSRDARLFTLAFRKAKAGATPAWFDEAGARSLVAALTSLLSALSAVDTRSPGGAVQVLSTISAMDSTWELPLVLQLVDQMWSYLTPAPFGTDPQKMTFRMGALQDEIARVWGLRAMWHAHNGDAATEFDALDDAMNGRRAAPHPPHTPRRKKR